MREPYQRDDGVWVLPLGGARIDRIGTKRESSLVLDLKLRNGSESTVSMPWATRSGPGPNASGTVRAATVTSDGTLSLALDDGTTIESSCQPEVESWQIVGPDKLFVVAVAGGREAAFWW